MDVKQLKYFYTIAEEGQITRAAKKLHMAQPPLSQQLKLLELELDVQLFERHGRTMTLTEAGAFLFEKAERILLEMEEIREEVKDRDEGLKGRLSIGTVKSCFSMLPERLEQFRSDFPGVTFLLRDGDSYQISELVKSREVEVGIVRLPLPMKEFDHVQLPDEPYVGVFHEEHIPAGAEKELKMALLEQQPLLLLHRVSGAGQYEMILEECRKHGFEPNVICECPDVTMLLSLVAKGVGASIVPASTLDSFHPSQIRVIPIADAEVRAKSAVIWLKQRHLSKQARRFVEGFGE
ncbi:LysR family transcriptional regulator [Alteribacter natronophilus]|uniref:LysR family transcriptional regulator n=1 Tax=Alteribacter natronophilus TaxID=2583810 RepID=UPI00110F4C57|nr:LysR family transcriptional regulator [Alteribacter natronophilus]TMW71074.1 LysR family transcriptional regulator [Alteribacter natronophilus]